jgi:U11/U12 small nuclear ribonucleoprotein 65 kDa protein
LKFLGKVLSAERASKPNENGGKTSGAQLGKDSKTSAVKSEDVIKPIDGEAKSGGFPIPEPIARRIGVDYPFPPHLEYASNCHFSVVCSCCHFAIYECISHSLRPTISDPV